MTLAVRLGWPTREWGLDHMDAIEFTDWIVYFSSEPDELKSDEVIHAGQLASFAALKKATKR